jgi:hypothetical protein
MNIYISFPAISPTQYFQDGFRTSWQQISHFVYKAILKKYPNNTNYFYRARRPYL